jgi:hypothetical protein
MNIIVNKINRHVDTRYRRTKYNKVNHNCDTHFFFIWIAPYQIQNINSKGQLQCGNLLFVSFLLSTYFAGPLGSSIILVILVFDDLIPLQLVLWDVKDVILNIVYLYIVNRCNKTQFSILTFCNCTHISRKLNSYC